MSDLEKCSAPSTQEQCTDEKISNSLGVVSKNEPAPQPPVSGRCIDRLVLLPWIVDPKAYSKTLKICITLIVASVAAIDPITITLYYRDCVLCSIVKNLLTQVF